MEQQTLIFLGPQGSGKGTQLQLLKEYLKQKDPGRDIVHFEAGARLREFGEEGGVTQDKIKASLLRGELQPVFILSYVMSRVLLRDMKGNEHFVVDGFPRTADQLAVFDSAMQFYERKNPTLLYISISDEEAVRRLLKRGRSDDTEESVRHRLKWSHEQVAPTLEIFRANPYYRVLDIDGERSVEEIHADILSKLGLA